MLNTIRKISAFVKKDFLIHFRYRFSFFLNWVRIIVVLLNVYFINRLLGLDRVSALTEYGSNYFSFVLIGLSFYTFLDPAVNGFSGAIRNEQLTGTLEAMLVKPVSIYTILFLMPAYSFIIAIFNCAICMFTGIVFLGATLVKINIFLFMLTLILSIISFMGIGIISASFVIIFKKGDPVAWLIGSFSWFFGGMFFPTQILPRPFQFISDILPITYSLRALRHILLIENPQSVIWPDIRALFLFCLVLFPLGLISFNYALKKAKQEGSLGKY